MSLDQRDWAADFEAYLAGTPTPSLPTGAHSDALRRHQVVLDTRALDLARRTFGTDTRAHTVVGGGSFGTIWTLYLSDPTELPKGVTMPGLVRAELREHVHTWLDRQIAISAADPGPARS